MKTYQLQGIDGDNIGLYITKKELPLESIQQLFDDAFKLAKSKEDKGEEIHIHDEVDAYLESRGIERVFADEITTEIL